VSPIQYYFARNLISDVGELESTLLHGFIKGSKIRQWLSQENCPPAIRECKTLIDRSYGRPLPDDHSQFQKVSTPAELKKLLRVFHIELTSSLTHRYVHISCHTKHLGNSYVMVHINGRQQDSRSVPVRISYILWTHDGAVKLAVHKLMAVKQSTPNPFRYFPHFNAEVYSPQFASDLVLVNLDWVDTHFALYEMSPDCAAVLNLSQVSFPHILYYTKIYNLIPGVTTPCLPGFCQFHGHCSFLNLPWQPPQILQYPTSAFSSPPSYHVCLIVFTPLMPQLLLCHARLSFLYSISIVYFDW
jgi:hypothetical protein